MSWSLVWVTVTSAVPPPLNLTSQVNVLPFSFVTSLGQEADVICVVEFDSEEFLYALLGLARIDRIAPAPRGSEHADRYNHGAGDRAPAIRRL